MDQERSQILMTLFEPGIQPLLDYLILSSLPCPVFFLLSVISLSSVSLPHIPKFLSILLSLLPYPPRVRMFQARVCPRLCTGPGATLTPSGVGIGSSEEWAAEATWKEKRDWVTGSAPRTLLREVLYSGLLAQLALAALLSV